MWGMGLVNSYNKHRRVTVRNNHVINHVQGQRILYIRRAFPSSILQNNQLFYTHYLITCDHLTYALGHPSPKYTIIQDLRIYRKINSVVFNDYIGLYGGLEVHYSISHALSTDIVGTSIWSLRFAGLRSVYREDQLYHYVRL